MTLGIEDYVVEWDDAKNEKNIRKHGVSFEMAAMVFWDKNYIELYDKTHSTEDEDRYIVIGVVKDVLFVVYTDKNNSIRLISARSANEYERKLYYGKNKEKN